MRPLQRLLPLLSIIFVARICLAQMPQNAQTDLYFPHLADGGASNSQWQTRFTFINTNSSPVSVSVYLYADGGGPLNLDFGSGPTSAASFTIPQNGTYILQSNIGPFTTTGWAYAFATLPVEATVAFRLIHNGTAQLEITAEPTLPSYGYRSVATPQVGVAVANVYSGTSLPVTVTQNALHQIRAAQIGHHHID